MTTPLAHVKDGKKYMWDGAGYDSEEAARAKMEEYEKDGFEVISIPVNGVQCVYTRRIAARQSAE